LFSDDVQTVSAAIQNERMSRSMMTGLSIVPPNRLSSLPPSYDLAIKQPPMYEEFILQDFDTVGRSNTNVHYLTTSLDGRVAGTVSDPNFDPSAFNTIACIEVPPPYSSTEVVFSQQISAIGPL